MRVALIARDKTGSLQIRLDTRDAHLAYIEATGVVETAGPLMDAAGAMNGSLIILNVPDMATAQEWAARDPYAQAGLFEDVTLTEWKKVIG